MEAGEAVSVLDHGFVRLIDNLGDDLSIVRAARVSHDAAWRAGEDAGSDARLIRYLMKNKHTSPFEMVEFVFECKMPIFVARQWVRHRTASLNEVSARYTELPGEFYFPLPEHIGLQSTSNKQARTFMKLTEEQMVQLLDDIEQVRAHCLAGYALYERLLSHGWPRELARMVLSLNIYTHWFWKIDLHNLMHFLELRLHEHSQYEIRVYAQAMLNLITPIVPAAMEAFKEFRLVK